MENIWLLSEGYARILTANKIDSIHDDTGSALHVNLITEHGLYSVVDLCESLPVVLIEFVFAYGLECLMGSPSSFKLACKNFELGKAHPVIFYPAVDQDSIPVFVPKQRNLTDADWEGYLDDLEDYGLSEYLDLYQSYLDSYNANMVK